MIVSAREDSDGAVEWSPALRLLADRGRRTASRSTAVAAALSGPLAAARVYTVWPSLAHPQFAVDTAHRPAAAWLRDTFEPDARGRRFPGPATWSALRTRGLLAGPPSRLATDALDAAGRRVDAMRLALYSPTGATNSKISCFAFRHGDAEPDVLVKAMPERRFAERLRHETEAVEAIRRRVSGAVADALPLAPLVAEALHGDYVVVQPVDVLASSTGSVTESAALAWLHGFQAATARAGAAWDAGDTAAAVASVRDAWGRARPAGAEAVVARAGALLAGLEGTAVRRCAVHGDFWSGNLAQRGDALRVYDWEWTRTEGEPFFDRWTWELGPLRREAERGATDLAPRLAAAADRVAAGLREAGADPRFALAMLAPSLAELTFRVRRATGRAGGAEAESALLMDAAAGLLASARA